MNKLFLTLSLLGLSTSCMYGAAKERDSYKKESRHFSKMERGQFSVDYWREVVSALKARTKNPDFINRAEKSLRRAETHLRKLKGLKSEGYHRGTYKRSKKGTEEKTSKAPETKSKGFFGRLMESI